MESHQVLVNTPAAAPAAVAERTEKFSLFALTAMVVGSMVGAGILSLPRAFATATGPFGSSTIRWCRTRSDSASSTRSVATSKAYRTASWPKR